MTTDPTTPTTADLGPDVATVRCGFSRLAPGDVVAEKSSNRGGQPIDAGLVVARVEMVPSPHGGRRNMARVHFTTGDYVTGGASTQVTVLRGVVVPAAARAVPMLDANSDNPLEASIARARNTDDARIDAAIADAGMREVPADTVAVEQLPIIVADEPAIDPDTARTIAAGIDKAARAMAADRKPRTTTPAAPAATTPKEPAAMTMTITLTVDEHSIVALAVAAAAAAADTPAERIAYAAVNRALWAPDAPAAAPVALAANPATGVTRVAPRTEAVTKTPPAKPATPAKPAAKAKPAGATRKSAVQAAGDTDPKVLARRAYQKARREAKKAAAAS